VLHSKSRHHFGAGAAAISSRNTAGQL